MDKDEYKNRLVALFNQYEFDRKSIMREFALSNNEVELGDIFIDHIGAIHVDKINIEFYTDHPRCIYYGRELKKDLTPTKRVLHRNAYQINKCKIIKKQTNN